MRSLKCFLVSAVVLLSGEVCPQTVGVPRATFFESVPLNLGSEIRANLVNTLVGLLKSALSLGQTTLGRQAGSAPEAQMIGVIRRYAVLTEIHSTPASSYTNIVQAIALHRRGGRPITLAVTRTAHGPS